MLFDLNNTIFRLASLFVNQTARPVFLTGKAGTGKTTFLRYIRENCFKKMAVVAPTGVAAINAGGVTMHSFFQLPFGPFIPVSRSSWDDDVTRDSDGAWRNSNPGDRDRSATTDQHSLFKNIRFNAAKRELLQELELLVIDEISMVRADTLDAVDTILRHFRQQPLTPFGGVQMLYIGDLFQLPPVVSNEEWALLKEHYQSPFFFDAQSVRQSPPVYLELKKIYRQKEADFIGILNNIRNNRADYDDLERLHEHYRPDFQPAKEENYIILTSHNAKASHINQDELAKLPARSYAFEAAVTGEFSDRAYPADKTLYLKQGAQVMFIKNDKGETRRYFNGKIATIKGISGEKIVVEFPGEKDDLIVEKETWKSIRYLYDKAKDRIEEEELGSFSQYPLRLAWAITIHKSQGLTFEKAIIDAGASFAPGQVYVALSRLTTIDGMILHSRIQPHCISTDERVIAFTERALAEDILQDQLQEDQQVFISRSLVAAFSWSRLVEEVSAFAANAVSPAAGYSLGPAASSFSPLALRLLDSASRQQETAIRFCRQLEQLLAESRSAAGSMGSPEGYQLLQERTEAAVAYFIKAIDQELMAPVQEQIAEIRGKKKIKKHLQTLAGLKTAFARKRQQLEQVLPIVKKEWVMIAGGSPPNEAPGRVVQKPRKGDTNRISLDLYKEGRTISEIAARRGLAVTTVETHLASFIPTGEIDVNELVPVDKITVVVSAIREIGSQSITPIKHRLGGDYSFSEIRAVMKYLEMSKKT
jgi:Helix-turn-helix domain/AAA domain/Helicase